RLVGGLQLQQREQLVHPRRDRQLLGGDAVHAALHQQLSEPALHGGPVALHLRLCLHLLGPQAVRDRGRDVRELRLERLRQRVRRVGGQDQRAPAGRGAAQRGGGGDGGLPDAALPGVEDRARR